MQEKTVTTQGKTVKKTKHRLLGTIVFIIIIALISAYLVTIFTFPSREEGDYIKERFNCFYAQDENTMDGIYIGASGVDRYWAAPQAYRDDGIAVFAMSSSSMPLVTYKYMIKEVLKTQEPKVLLLDIRPVLKSPDGTRENFVRRITDNLRWSKNKIETTDAALAYLKKSEEDNEIDESDPSFYFSFLKYHSRWKGDMRLYDFIHLHPKTNYMGFAAHLETTYNIKPKEYTDITYDRIAINPETEKILRDLLKFIGTLDCEVLFVDEPYSASYERQAKVNYAEDIVRSYGVDILKFQDYAMYEQLGLDFDTDFYNTNHVNIVGALKYTAWLGDYLKETYNLPDRRGDAKYDKWESAYRDYRADTKDGLADLRKRIEEN